MTVTAALSPGFPTGRTARLANGLSSVELEMASISTRTIKVRVSQLAPCALTLWLFAAVGQPATHGASLPRWVKNSMSTHFNGPLDKATPYIVLLNEAVTTVGKNGKAETRYRFVARILTGEGRVAARRDVYSDEETSISLARGWHLRPGGKVVAINKSDT